MVMLNFAPRALPTARTSFMILPTMSNSEGSAMMSVIKARQGAERVESRVARQFAPDLVANAWRGRNIEACLGKEAGNGFEIGRHLARRFAKHETTNIGKADLAGIDDLGALQCHAADHPLRPDQVPQLTAGIELFELKFGMAALRIPVEIPPGNTVQHHDDAGVFLQQGGHVFCRRTKLMAFEA